MNRCVMFFGKRVKCPRPACCREGITSGEVTADFFGRFGQFFLC